VDGDNFWGELARGLRERRGGVRAGRVDRASLQIDIAIALARATDLPWSELSRELGMTLAAALTISALAWAAFRGNPQEQATIWLNDQGRHTAAIVCGGHPDRVTGKILVSTVDDHLVTIDEITRGCSRPKRLRIPITGVSAISSEK
jgi:hypothetical protein